MSAADEPHRGAGEARRGRVVVPSDRRATKQAAEGPSEGDQYVPVGALIELEAEPEAEPARPGSPPSPAVVAGWLYGAAPPSLPDRSCDLGQRARAAPGQDLTHVSPNGGHTDPELIGDLLLRETRYRAPDDLLLSS